MSTTHCIVFGFALQIGLQKLQHLSRTCTKPKVWPIKVFTILKYCKNHPNQEWYKQVKNLLINKFHYKMDPSQIHTLTKTNPKTFKNHFSANQYAPFVDLKIIQKLENGAWICDDELQFQQLIKIKMIPQNDKVRMVLDYSSPYDGVSINSIVPDEAVTVKLPNFVDLCTFAYGENNNIKAMGKIDFKAAFEQIAIAESQQKYGGYRWRNHNYRELSMPPGTRAAVQSMQLFGEAVRYTADQMLPPALRGNTMGYVDDNIIRGRSLWECLYQTLHFIIVCTDLGIKINVEKTIFYAQSIVALGSLINLHDNAKDAKVTAERVTSYLHELKKLSDVITKPRWEMDSILGKLFSTTPYAWPLKALTRPFIDLLPKNTNSDNYNRNQPLTITDEVKRHAELYIEWLPRMNGIKLERVVKQPTIQENMKSDASPKGGGACTGKHWTLWKWEPEEVNPNGYQNTPELEIKALECGFYAFAPIFEGKEVLFEVDSQTARDALIKKDSSNRAMWKAIKRICLFAIENHTRWHVKWLPRALNDDSDALSKNDIDRFKRFKANEGQPIDPAMTLFQRPPESYKIDLNDYTKDIPYGKSLGKKRETMK